MRNLLRMCFLFTIFFFSYQNLCAQNHFELYYGINERAKSDVEPADEILKKSPGFILGAKYSRIYSIKDKTYLGSAGIGFLIHKLYFSNLKYEFGRTDDGPDVTKLKNATMGFAKVNFCRLFNYDKAFSNQDFYFGTGIFLIFNASDVSGNAIFYDNGTNSNREYWSYSIDFDGLELLPGLTAFASYKVKVFKKLFLVFGLNYEITPFSAADLDFTINSRDGVIKGSFYQKIHNANFSIGFGF